MVANYNAAVAAAKQCIDTVNAEPQWAPLWRHMPKDASSPTMGQLADESFADAEGVALLEAHHDAIMPCRSNRMSQLEAVDNRVANAYGQLASDQDQITLAVAERKITWGSANQRNQQIVQSLRQQLAELKRQIIGELNEENAAEIDQRQRIGNALQAAGAAIQASQPIVTTCHGGDGYASCVTRQ